MRAKNGRSQWYWLLLIPFFFCLWVPYFNRLEPTFLGLPFFYWYQFLWVAISAGITGIVYRLTD